MTPNKRTYNSNLIKLRHSYTLAEIAETLKIHPRTVQRWRKQGLKVIDESTKPYFVIGEEVRRFLKETAQKRKFPLKPGEFFCTKCRTQRKSLPDKFSFRFTGKLLGKHFKQVMIRGVCELCGQSFLVFSSDRKVQEMQKNGLLLPEHKAQILGSEESSLNAYIRKDQECLNQTSKMNE